MRTVNGNLSGTTVAREYRCGFCAFPDLSRSIPFLAHGRQAPAARSLVGCDAWNWALHRSQV